MKYCIGRFAQSFLACAIFFSVTDVVLAAVPTLHAALLDDAGISKTLSVPLAFEKNEGQFDPSVLFLARSTGYQIILTRQEAVLVFSEVQKRSEINSKESQSDERSALNTEVLRIQFEKSPSLSSISAEGDLYPSNYFLGGDSGVSAQNYARVHYSSIHPGIDILFHGERGAFEYDFLVAPKADATKIKLRIYGADTINASADGELTLGTKSGDIKFRQPVAYQDIDGTRVYVNAEYAADQNQISFLLGKYDVSRPLVIDPMLSYSTTFGWGTPNRVTVDSSGNAYVAGYTTIKTLPASTGYQRSLLGAQDAWVAKIDPTGKQVLWATYLGARNATSDATGIAVDSSGNVYVSGTTNSTSFPHTSGAYKATFSGTTSAYVTKLSSSGNALVYSTFVPVMGSIALDPSNNTYIYGGPTAGFAPTANAFMSTTANLAILKLNASGSGAVYASYLGGSWSSGIAVDSSGNAYVGGSTTDSAFPVVNAVQPTRRGGTDAFVSKINPSGTALVYSTFLGGSGDDFGNALGIDSAGNVIIVGQTVSSDFPTTLGAFQPAKSSFPQAVISNVFVAKISSAGNSLLWATYLGGTYCATTGCSGTIFTCPSGPGCPPNIDVATAVVVDAAGFVTVGGYTTSRDFPLMDQIQPLGPTNDDDSHHQPFLTKFGPNGDRLVYSTAFGTRGQYPSTVQSLSVDPSGAVYAIGPYDGVDQFPLTPGAPIVGNYMQFLVKVSPGKYPTTVTSSKNPATSSQLITFSAFVLSTSAGGTVSFKDGTTVIGTSPMTNGRAILTVSLAAGAHKITAVYSGDGIASPPVYQVVTNP